MFDKKNAYLNIFFNQLIRFDYYYLWVVVWICSLHIYRTTPSTSEHTREWADKNNFVNR